MLTLCHGLVAAVRSAHAPCLNASTLPLGLALTCVVRWRDRAHAVYFAFLARLLFVVGVCVSCRDGLCGQGGEVRGAATCERRLTSARTPVCRFGMKGV